MKTINILYTMCVISCALAIAIAEVIILETYFPSGEVSGAALEERKSVACGKDKTFIQPLEVRSGFTHIVLCADKEQNISMKYSEYKWR